MTPATRERARGLGLTLNLSHPMSYSSPTALGAQIATLQTIIKQYGQLNTQGQFLGPSVATGLSTLLTQLVQLDQQQLAAEGEFASQVAGIQAGCQAQISNLQAQLSTCQQQTQGRSSGPPPNVGPAPASTSSSGPVTASAPAPAPAPTNQPTGTYVSAGATAGIAGATGLAGGVIGFLIGRRNPARPSRRRAA